MTEFVTQHKVLSLDWAGLLKFSGSTIWRCWYILIAQMWQLKNTWLGIPARIRLVSHPRKASREYLFPTWKSGLVQFMYGSNSLALRRPLIPKTLGRDFKLSQYCYLRLRKCWNSDWEPSASAWKELIWNLSFVSGTLFAPEFDLQFSAVLHHREGQCHSNRVEVFSTPLQYQKICSLGASVSLPFRKMFENP